MNEKDIVSLPTISPISIPGNEINPGQVSSFLTSGFYSISSFGYADNFDASYSFVLPFYVDQNVNSILQVYLNLLFQKYRAFSKASSGESSHTHSVTIPNHTHSVSVPAHSHSITGKATGGDDSAHQHVILVQKDSWDDSTPNADRVPIFVDSQGLPGPHGNCTQGDLGQLKGNWYGRNEPPNNNDISFKTNCTIDSHTHPISGITTDSGGSATPTSSDGGGTTVASASGSEHSHALTFGIYEAAAFPIDVGLKIDGVDRTSALGGPWNPSSGSPSVLNLDLTEYITTIGYHTLELSTSTMGRCIPLLWIKAQSNK